MATNILIESPYEFFTARDGRPLANGRIYIGLPDQDPENFPQASYFDVGGTTPATQPIRTNVAGYPSDTTGNPQRIFTSGAYSIRVRDSNGVQVFYAADSSDGFFGVSASDLANNTNPALGSGMVGYVLQVGATGTNVHDKIARDIVDVKDFGAVGDGVTNDKVAFDAAVATGRTILLPAGNYNVPSGNYGSSRFYSFDGATTTNGTIAVVDPLANSLAVGTCVAFPCSPAALPFGWLHRNGATLNRSVYPQLWAFADASGNIVDEVNKPTNKSAFGRGNGSSTFSLPDDRATNQGYADAGAGVDATFVLGKQIAVTAASAAPGITVRSSILTPAIRAFASATNQGSIDIQALQAQLTTLQNRSLTSGPLVPTTSGTAVDFVGLPSALKRITIMLNGVSTNGASVVLIQLGTSGGIENTGYSGAASITTGAGASLITYLTSGITTSFATAASTRTGQIILSRLSGNTWISSYVMAESPNGQVAQSSGSKTLVADITTVRITTANGTDVFDAGSVSIIYEG